SFLTTPPPLAGSAPLPLPAALPICRRPGDACRAGRCARRAEAGDRRAPRAGPRDPPGDPHRGRPAPGRGVTRRPFTGPGPRVTRSEEHTSELQSLTNLVCRLLLEKN